MRCECQNLTHSLPDIRVKLNQYRLIEISGVDAEKYLQGQLTCDVTKLVIGAHTLTAHCDPKGKISSLFRLYRQNESQFMIVIHHSLLPEALVQLKKYAVFSKVTFSELSTPIYGLAGNASGQILKEFCQNTICLTIATKQPHHLVWGIDIEPNAPEQLWDLLDIQDGIPILLQQNQGEFIPQALNLQEIEQAISFSKGCYIGQETVARAKYRGINKRVMFTLAGTITDEANLPDIAGAIEMQLEEHWRKTGVVLNYVIYQQTLWVQVVLNKESDDTQLFRIGANTLHIHHSPETTS